MAKLHLWQKASNYMGEEYPDYYVVYSRARDSGNLDNANFEAALARLGGESDTVIAPRSGHWAGGWLETILVRKDDEKAVAKAQKIADDLANYPVLDDDLYSQKETDSTISNIKDAGYKYGLTDDEAYKVYRWLDDQGVNTESTDDTGYYPNDDDLERAVNAIRRKTGRAEKRVAKKTKLTVAKRAGRSRGRKEKGRQAALPGLGTMR